MGEGLRSIPTVENVSSMDKEAAHEISMALGVKPCNLQSSDAVPISRPRFCWTNKDLPWMNGVTILDKGDYFEVVAECEYPVVQQWIREDSVWPSCDSGAVFPTCMKAINVPFWSTS